MVAVMEGATTDIRSDVIRELAAKVVLKNARIGVEEHAGTVILTGLVDCYARKLAAQEAVENIFGVREVVNEIEVARDGVYGWRNVDLLEGARRHLKSNFLLAKAPIEIGVADNWLILSGRVETLAEKREAARAVASLPSLRGIRNEIEVVPPRADPDELRREVEETVVRVLGAGAASVEVCVAGRVVSLVGTVDELRQKDACMRAVAEIPGIAEVQDLVGVAAG